MKKLKIYSILALLATVLLIGVWLWLRGVVNDSDITLSATDERAEMTPAVIDSIRSIGQWELSTVVLTILMPQNLRPRLRTGMRPARMMAVVKVVAASFS